MRGKTFRIGARGSNLSLQQTRIVSDLLRAIDPEIRIQVVVIATQGDLQLDLPLPVIGGKGVFTQEIEAALMANEIDFAVHSLKDLPVADHPELVIGAIPERAAVEDVLVSRTGVCLDHLPPGATVGTSSLRRAAQLLQHRADLRPLSIRGNIETRLRKAAAEDGDFDAIVLARAGLDRLNIAGIAVETLSLELMLPAPGQGALAVQSRNDLETLSILAAIHDPATAWATAAERAFLSGLGGGCSAPIAAYATIAGERMTLFGRVLAVDGSASVDVQSYAHVVELHGALAAGRDLAVAALARGAGDLLGVHV